ncbi:MAG: ABC transporter ATP-binding protein [Nitrospiria bacterium]
MKWTKPMMLSADFQYRLQKGSRLNIKFSIPIDNASTTVIFGPSGSGKSTLLHCLAGIEIPSAGFIRCAHVEWFNRSKQLHLSPGKRSVGLLFQDYPLFPHLRVYKNIIFGIQSRLHQDKVDAVKKWVRLFALSGKENRYPHELSGGERQRVALAQILAAEPSLLLLDEPFSALDSYTRTELQGQLRQWLSEKRRSAVVVTHDLADALALGNHLIVLSEGNILQQGHPIEIFSQPAVPAVAKIIGIENLIGATVLDCEEDVVTLVIGNERLVASGSALPKQACFAAIRADEVILEKGKGSKSSARNRLPGIVKNIKPMGSHVGVEVDCGFLLKTKITQRSLQALSLAPDNKITAVIKASAIKVIPSL